MTVRTLSDIRGDIITAVDGTNGWRHSVTWLVHEEQQLQQRFMVQLDRTALPNAPGRRRTDEDLGVESRVVVTAAYRMASGNPSTAYASALDAEDDLRASVLTAAVGQPYHLLYLGTERDPDDDGWLRSEISFMAKHRI